MLLLASPISSANLSAASASQVSTTKGAGWGGTCGRASGTRFRVGTQPFHFLYTNFRSGLVESTRTHSSSPTLRAPDPSRPSPSPSERPALPTPKFKIRRQAAQIQKQVPKHETRPTLAVKTLRAKPARPKPLKSGINTGMGLIIWVITSNLMFVSWVKPVHSSSIIAQNTQMHPCFGYQGCCIWHGRFLLLGSSQKPHAECLRSKESYEQCALG